MSDATAPCSQCGVVHDLDDMELSFFRPDAVIALPDDEREQDVKESNDLCSIRSERFFVRATLPLPVHERDISYRLGLWVETSEATFNRIRELWRDDNQADEKPFEVTLANSIRALPATCGLPVLLQLTGPKTRPDIIVPMSRHPLCDEQRTGITAHRANQYTTSMS
ncbi:DUF2199 domain-containing protein [Pinirhizobacter sp.]|jgi:hypothetical protein|uniref:DUF2199 domain-containing protein n=1 Tax=Pinirhizobacter sp. TaxID=2950432 RepID=UPI002F3E6591